MIRYHYDMLTQGSIYGVGDQIVYLPDSAQSDNGVVILANIIAGHPSRFVPRPIQLVSELGNEPEDFSEGVPLKTVESWLSQKVVPLWEEGPLRVTLEQYERMESGVLGAPGWWESDCPDHVVHLLKLYVEARAYARPYQMMQGELDWWLDSAEAGYLPPIEQLFGRFPIIPEPIGA